MQVTEGSGSRADRRRVVAVALGLFATAAALCAALPVPARALLWTALLLAAMLVARSLFCSLVAGFLSLPARREPCRSPGIVFIIPVLNEVESLRRTMPALESLEHGGELVFCYVCEGASTDGSAQFIQRRAVRDERIVPLAKTTPPAGRGAAIRYGLARAPRLEVVGFLDADHALPQKSLEALAAAFGGPDPPEALQGACATSNPQATWLARLLAIERDWMEAVELEVNPRLGGLTHFGGGQGFFRGSLIRREEFRIDEDMILDDTDLSCRLNLAGQRVHYDRNVITYSTQPERITEFLDQRYRWARGWAQLAGKYCRRAIAERNASPRVRADMFRLAATPLAAVLLFFGFAAAAGGLIARGGGGTCLPALGLLWPFLLGFQPILAGRSWFRASDVPLSIIGIPMLYYTYAALCTVAAVDTWLLRRPARYAKTAKRA